MGLKHIRRHVTDGYKNYLVGVLCLSDICDALIWELMYIFGKKISTLNRPQEATLTKSKALLPSPLIDNKITDSVDPEKFHYKLGNPNFAMS